MAIIEIEPARLLHHREGDPSGADYRNRRHLEDKEVIVKHVNGKSMRILLAATLSVSLSALGYMLVRDRVRIDADITRIDAAVVINTGVIAQHQATLVELRTKQDRALLDLAEIRAALVANGDKLDRVLLELRRKP